MEVGHPGPIQRRHDTAQIIGVRSLMAGAGGDALDDLSFGRRGSNSRSGDISSVSTPGQRPHVQKDPAVTFCCFMLRIHLEIMIIRN
jgi:hypothetical protein